MPKERLNAILALERLVSTWPRVDGPSDPKWQAWLGDVRAHLSQVQPEVLARFDHLSRLMMLQLSTYTLEPIWNEMLATVRAAIAQAKVGQKDLSDKLYGPGEFAELARDLVKIVAAAQSSLFIVEPYASAKLFTEPLGEADPAVDVRLLTKKAPLDLSQASVDFAAKRQGRLELRRTSDIHDRVIFVDDRDCWVLGQSMKNAATSMPTYLLPVVAVNGMVNLYEKLWAAAVPL
jgi:hypothetical protein